MTVVIYWLNQRSTKLTINLYDCSRLLVKPKEHKTYTNK